jgi:hypothetical protein
LIDISASGRGTGRRLITVGMLHANECFVSGTDYGRNKLRFLQQT